MEEHESEKICESHGFIGMIDKMRKDKVTKLFPHLEDIEKKLDVDEFGDE